jgi:hypothetical protein
MSEKKQLKKGSGLTFKKNPHRGTLLHSGELELEVVPGAPGLFSLIETVITLSGLRHKTLLTDVSIDEIIEEINRRKVIK